jgi:hypothetical protein
MKNTKIASRIVPVLMGLLIGSTTHLYSAFAERELYCSLVTKGVDAKGQPKQIDISFTFSGKQTVAVPSGIVAPVGQAGMNQIEVPGMKALLNTKGSFKAAVTEYRDANDTKGYDRVVEVPSTVVQIQDFNVPGGQPTIYQIYINPETGLGGSRSSQKSGNPSPADAAYCFDKKYTAPVVAEEPKSLAPTPLPKFQLPSLEQPQLPLDLGGLLAPTPNDTAKPDESPKKKSK